MKELERTFLAKKLPDLSRCESVVVSDTYVPASAEHPVVRIRSIRGRSGDRFEMTKKTPVAGDRSHQEEQTILLSKDEFDALARLEGKRVRKRRYFYDHNGTDSEIDVFLGALSGLVLVDVEFRNEKERDEFEKPDFCLADVTQENFVAGGMLAGRSYGDIENELKRLGYGKIEPHGKQ